MDKNLFSTRIQSQKWSKITVIGLTVALIAIPLGSSVPRAYGDGGDTTLIHGCVRNNGSIRIVGADESCKKTGTPTHWSATGPAGPAGPTGPMGPAGPAIASDSPIITDLEWKIAAAASTATAAGYCLANHTWTKGVPEFVTPEHPGGFTPSGYELPTLPVVGAVRRNFTRDRIPGDPADPNSNLQSCSQACSVFMSGYAPTYRGVALQRRHSNGSMQADGLNDLGGYVAGTTLDTDFYTHPTENFQVVAGIHARVDGYLEADVAQADNCCCGLVSP